MEKEEIAELKLKKEHLQKEIDKKQWEGFKTRFSQSSLLEKAIFILGLVTAMYLLYLLGGVIRTWIGH